MRKFYFLLLLSIPIVAADMPKKDLCLNALQGFVPGKEILTEFARKKFTSISSELDVSSHGAAIKRYHSAPEVKSIECKRKKTSLYASLFKKKAKEVHSIENKNTESMETSLTSLRFNVFLGNVYGTKGDEFNYRARGCIQNLKQYHLREECALQSSPIKEVDSEMDKLHKQIKQKNNNSLKALIEKYEIIVAKQIEYEECDLSPLASDIPKVIADNLYNLSYEHSNELFNTIDLALMRSAEIFIQANNWNEKGKKIKEFENIIETINYYRKKQLEEVHQPILINAPLKLEYLREILDTQRKLLS